MTTRELIEHAGRLMAEHLEGLGARPVRATASPDELREALGHLPDKGADPDLVVRELAAVTTGGAVASPGPRYFGFVTGGVLPAALGADMLVTAQDQNAGPGLASPGAAVVDEVTGRWVIDLLDLPESTSHGFVTGATMANFTGLAAARNHVLAKAGWDVEAHGLQGAPVVNVVVGAGRHITVDRSLRMLGFGAERSVVVAADGHGRMRADELGRALAGGDGPTIVIAQAGHVNTGAFDPLRAICELAHERGAWVHVDGAFGLWAAASPRHAHLLDGFERADSWATDAHKWLNVPYDCGIVLTTHPDAHEAAMMSQAAYLMRGEMRQSMDWVPESSRRNRALPVYAALRSLGREGMVEMIERNCRCATRFAETLGAEDGIEILNDVVLNQVLVRFGDDDRTTQEVIRRVQDDGTMWAGGSSFDGRAVMRISVSNWATTEDDIDVCAEAILRCFAASA